MVCINVNDPNAAKYDTILDVSSEILNIIKDFLIMYKTPAGKPKNVLFNDAAIWNKFPTMKIVEEVHKFWFDLVNNNEETINNSDESRRDLVKQIKIIAESS